MPLNCIRSHYILIWEINMIIFAMWLVGQRDKTNCGADILLILAAFETRRSLRVETGWEWIVCTEGEVRFVRIIKVAPVGDYLFIIITYI